MPTSSATSLKAAKARSSASPSSTIAERLGAGGERVAPAMLAEDDPVRGKPDIFRFHDLVGFPILQHAVLVDARFVGEGIGADDRLVARRRRRW